MRWTIPPSRGFGSMARQIPPGRLEKRHGIDIGALRIIFMSHVSLTLLVLKTRQVEQLRVFYQTLGVDLVEEQHGKGPVHFAGLVGDVVIEVYPLPDDGTPVDTSTRLGFAVKNVAE